MEIFIAGFLLSLSLCLDLGIVNTALIKTGIEHGFLKSLNIGIGSSLGDLFYAVLSLFGISIILKYTAIRWILWIAGTLILLYFCYNAFCHIFKPINDNEKDLEIIERNKSSNSYLLSGFLLALSSPTSILWFATIGGSVIASQELRNSFDTFIFLSGFFTASIVWSIGLAYLSYKGGKRMKDKIRNIFSIVSAILFLILTIYVFIDGYRTLIR